MFGKMIVAKTFQKLLNHLAVIILRIRKGTEIRFIFACSQCPGGFA